MEPNAKQFITEVDGKTVIFESGMLAGQAGGAVTVRLGDSVVFSAATMSAEPKEGQDFFPLTVEYEERLYAGGRIPGSFFRREGRPAGDVILTSRLIDRPLRPLFSQDIRNEVQVILQPFRGFHQSARYPRHQRGFRFPDDLRYPVGRPGGRGPRRSY